MPDEEVVQQLADQITAPEQATTVEPVAEEQPTPEIAEAQEPEKVFTQKDVDAAIQKRLAREQRKWEREQQSKTVEVPPAEVPPMDFFATPDAYAEALAERKAYEIVQQKEAQRQESRIAEQWIEKEEEAKEKYVDYEQVAYNTRLAISETMKQAMMQSELGPDIAYYFGTNPKEALRIYQLPPIAQVKEIGRLEMKLETSPPVKKSSNAPSPIDPVIPKGGTTITDHLDPRANMDTATWIRAEEERQRKRLLERRNG